MTAARRTSRSLAALLVAAFLAPAAARAGVPEGFAWLATQPNADGSFGGRASSLATKVQSTAEVVVAYQSLGREAESPYAAALAFLCCADAETSTEYVARRILAAARGGQDVTALVADLRRRQNPDGGFGEQEGYASSVLDTAFALEALAALPSAPESRMAVGYLLGRQGPDGGWADGANETSVYLTALAARSLSAYRFVYAGVAGAASGAQAFLLGRRTAETWGETHLTALALTAILPGLVDLAPVSGSVAALQAGQLADGSWDLDAYTTALALRALHLAAQPRPDPTVGAVGGRILDGTTGAPLDGVTVTVTGVSTHTARTSPDGGYLIVGVKQGPVSLTAARDGYLTAGGTGTVIAGATLDFSTALARDPQPVPIVLRGLVVDAANDAPLAGATAHVRNTSFTAQTGPDGRFELTGIPAGSLQAEVVLAGYVPAAFAVSAPGGATVDLGKIALAAGTSGTTGRVIGSVVDSLSGQPLAGVLISLSGSDDKSAFTDQAGAFAIDGIAPGAVNVTASRDGYDTATAAGAIVAGATLRFDARLVRTGDPARATITGTAIDVETQAPLAGVLVRVDAGVRSGLSAGNGSFEVGDVPAGQLTIDLVLAGYTTVSYSVSAPRGGLIALGVVGLARVGDPGGANRDPIITSRAPTTGSAGLMYAYNVVANDPDGDALVYALGEHPSGMTIDPANGQLRWIPTVEQVGPQHFTVVVTDARAAIATEAATVSIAVGGSKSYVITDVQTLTGLYIDDLVPSNYSVATYVRGAVPGFVSAGPPCPISWFNGSGTVAQALNTLERLTAPNSMGAQPATGSDIIFDLRQPYATVAVFPQIDHAPFPQEGIEYTVWGSNDPDAAFPDGWKLGTLIAIYRKGYVTTPSCAGQVETDDYTGLYTFGTDTYRYLRVRTDFSISIFDTPAHTTWSGEVDDSGLPGWQSSEGEIDAAAGMVCEVPVQADAGPDVVGRTGQAIAFDATGSAANVLTYGWDLEGDGTIDFTGARPSRVFNAAFEGDVRLLVVDNRGCVGTDTVHVSIEVDRPRPDLTVETVDAASVVTDLQTLQVRGSVHVVVRNIGAVPADRPALVTVFEDGNGNGRFDPGTDNALGGLTMPSALAPGATATLDVPLNGVVAFRDAVLTAMVDSDGAIDEAREDNNTGSSASLCSVPPSTRTFSPALKWQWTGSAVLPSHNQVMSAPVVAPLEDTNGDGRIDQADVPSVIFHAFAGSNYNADGVLRALSGRDGHELWSVTNPAHRTLPAGSIAVADIDGDGMVEIIAPRNGSGIIVFEHTGAFKWQSTIPSGVLWGGASVADLDADGRPEIVVGRTVLNRDGSLRWQGTSYHGGHTEGPLAVVADIDLDGRPEVVAGAAAYSSTGQLLWNHATVGDGFAAVANFNADPYPEIVVVTLNARVSMLDRTGRLLWGPTTLPGGGRGGPPTIADFDGDGTADIGVAAATRYTVLRANGSVLWSTTVQDASSSSTGSSVFDFDGDGSAEVVYADERFLRIYRGTDGQVLFQVPNTSGTTHELPVVADVDADGHADIVVCANQLLGSGITGIRVYTDANNSWVPTRRIWNQHTYHITNVNDDGTVPAIEANSWQVHNTYRLNALVGVDANLLPDLTASLLRVTVGAGGRPVTITVRIGNAGGGPAGAAAVAFYEGDPAAGGVLIGTATVGPLGPGGYQDVSLADAPNVTGTTDLYVVVDPADLVHECRETNNTVRRVTGTQSLFGDISVGTDAPVYGANRPVSAMASVTNLSALPGAFRVELQIEDAGGAVVAALAIREVGPLGGGAASHLTEIWNTGAALAGSYRLRGRLFGLTGVLLDEATSTFLVRHDTGGGVAVTLSAATDRPTYHTTDQVLIEDVVANVSVNTIVTGATLRLAVRNPLGATLPLPDAPLSELNPGAVRSLLAPLALLASPVGTYQVQAMVVEQGTEGVLATASASFQVVNDLAKAVTGAVSVSSARVEVGQPQTCTDRVSNTGTASLPGLEVRHLLANVDTEQEVDATSEFVDLASGAADTDTREIATAGLSVGNYACLVQARVQGELRTLAYATFAVVEPPIRIAAEMRMEGKGRLLVLLDRPHCHRPGDDDDDDDCDDDGHHRDAFVQHDNDRGSECDRDPHGPRSAPGLRLQRERLEALLRQAGWSYTLTETAADFTREMRTGGYSVHALLSEDVKLDERVQRELREAVFRGEGLLVAGAHDNRNQGLLDALGIRQIGSDPKAAAVDLTPGFPGAMGALPLLEDDHILRVRRRHAATVGVYVSRSRSGHDHDPCPSWHGNDRDDDRDGDHDDDDDDDDDDCGGRFPDAVTLNRYGLGRAVFAGFDLLATATQDDAPAAASALLRAALEAVNPPVPLAVPGAVVPIVIDVLNQGNATVARVVVTVPENTQLVDAIGGDIAGNTVTWDFDLAQSGSVRLDFWLSLAAAPETVTVTAVVSAPDSAGVYQPRAEASLDIPMVASLENRNR